MNADPHRRPAKRKRVLKRTVEVTVGPDRQGHYQAIVHRGPEKALRLIGTGGTEQDAVESLLGQLQYIGYSGNARIVG